MEDKKIVNLSVNEESLKHIYMQEVQKHLEKIEKESLLLDSKQLCKLLNLSWPTIEKLFLQDPDFPKMRVGTKWLFNRNEVQRYVDSWSDEIRQNGGRINLK